MSRDGCVFSVVLYLREGAVGEQDNYMRNIGNKRKFYMRNIGNKRKSICIEVIKR